MRGYLDLSIGGVHFQPQLFRGLFHGRAIGVFQHKCSRLELDAVSFKSVFSGIHGRAGQAETQGSQSIVGVVLDQQGLPRAINSARRLKLPTFFIGASRTSVSTTRMVFTLRNAPSVQPVSS